MREEQGVLQSKCLLLGYVLGSVTSNEPPRYLQGITNDSSLARRSKKMSDTIRRNERKKKMHCTICTICTMEGKVQKVQKVQGKKM